MSPSPSGSPPPSPVLCKMPLYPVPQGENRPLMQKLLQWNHQEGRLVFILCIGFFILSTTAGVALERAGDPSMAMVYAVLGLLSLAVLAGSGVLHYRYLRWTKETELKTLQIERLFMQQALAAALRKDVVLRRTSKDITLKVRDTFSLPKTSFYRRRSSRIKEQ